MNGAHSSGTPTDMDLTKAKTYPKKPTDKWVVTKVKSLSNKAVDMDQTKAKTYPNKPAEMGNDKRKHIERHQISIR